MAQQDSNHNKGQAQPIRNKRNIRQIIGDGVKWIMKLFNKAYASLKTEEGRALGSLLGVIFAAILAAVVAIKGNTISSQQNTIAMQANQINQGELQLDQQIQTSAAAMAIMTGTAGTIYGTAAAEETATGRAEATTNAIATQGSIQATVTQARASAESDVYFKAYYFCSRTLDIDGINLPLDLTEKLNGIGVSFGKIYQTPYWAAMHQSGDRQYMFLALANRGTVYIDPQEATNITWEPTEETPVDWLTATTIQRDGRIEAGIANVLLVADQPSKASSPAISTQPPITGGDPSLTDVTPLPDLSTLLQGSNSSPIFVCDYPGNWDVQKIQFALTYTPKDLPPRSVDVVLSAEDLDHSITPLLDELQRH